MSIPPPLRLDSIRICGYRAVFASDLWAASPARACDNISPVAIIDATGKIK